MEVAKGSKTALTGTRYVVGLGTEGGAAGLVDLTAVLLGPDGRVRGDELGLDRYSGTCPPG